MIIVIENNLQTVQNESTPDKNDSLYILGALMVLGWRGGGEQGDLLISCSDWNTKYPIVQIYEKFPNMGNFLKNFLSLEKESSFGGKKVKLSVHMQFSLSELDSS